MLFSEFYSVIRSEESAAVFLRQHGLLDDETAPPTCIREGCGGETKLYTRKKMKADGTETSYICFRCVKKGCQRMQSARRGNDFFTYRDVRGRAHSNLSICKILEIVFLWCHGMSQIKVQSATGLCHQAVIDWFNLCRDVPARMWARRVKMGGPGTTVQMDETLLRGKRKGNKGRLLLGDREPEAEDKSSEDEDLVADVPNGRRNYGRRIEGPWVFGLATKLDNGVVERRFFIVLRRDRQTLHNLIQAEVEPGTTLHSDEWPAYKGIDQHGYVHKTVNHSENFVDPESGAHTQLIESLWTTLKLKVLKEMRGTTQDMKERYLIEEWWRGLNQKTFEAFLRDMALTFRN